MVKPHALRYSYSTYKGIPIIPSDSRTWPTRFGEAIGLHLTEVESDQSTVGENGLEMGESPLSYKGILALSPKIHIRYNERLLNVYSKNLDIGRYLPYKIDNYFNLPNFKFFYKQVGPLLNGNDMIFMNIYDIIEAAIDFQLNSGKRS